MTEKMKKGLALLLVCAMLLALLPGQALATEEVPEEDDRTSIIDELAALIDEAMTLVEASTETDYTPESWLALLEAILEATLLVADGEATQEELEAALAALEAALDLVIAVYGIALLVHGEVPTLAEFGPIVVGNVDTLEPLEVTIENTGNVETGELTVTLSDAGADSFVLLAEEVEAAAERANGEEPGGPVTISSIPVDETATFTVVPYADADPGVHTATVTVAAAATAAVEEIEPQTFEVRLIVRPSRAALEGALESIDQLLEHNYTQQSWWRMMVAVSLAEFVMHNEFATQEQINNAYEALVAARDMLVLAPLPFTDVAGHWALNNGSIEFVWRHGIMTGTSATLFAPEDTLTRAQFARILWNMEGRPEAEFSPVFSDVPDEATSAWYNIAVLWAYEHDIVRGRPGGLFAPHDIVTRQEIATMLHRYAQWKELDVEIPADFDLTNFPDSDQVVDWAEAGMLWAVYNEIIRGADGGALLPLATANRAECATMIQRFAVAFAE
ncbi:MAG: S-layer homology domain-containing protein [Oscillospiraceae bacterium]|nr:S-layer homology domain-containing protein [Oscillospiraceae bacterium]